MTALLWVALGCALGFALCAWLTAGRIADVQAERARELKAQVERTQAVQADFDALHQHNVRLMGERDAAQADLAGRIARRSEAGRKAAVTRKARAVTVAEVPHGE